MIGLLLKIAMTATIVVAASVVVERSGPFIGSLIASLPTAGGAAMIILAIEHPPAFIAQSAVGSMVSNAVCAIFALTYAALAQRRSLPVSLGGAFLVWFCCAGLRGWWIGRAASAVLLNAVVFPLAILAGRGFRAEGAVERASTFTGADLAWRAGVVTLCVIVVTAASSVDRLVRLRPVRLLPGGDGLVLRDPASAHRRPGRGQRGGACAGPADRAGLEPARRAFAGGAARRVVVLRGRACRSASAGTRCCGACASGDELSAAALLPAP